MQNKAPPSLHLDLKEHGGVRGVPAYPKYAEDLRHLLREQRTEGQLRGRGAESQLPTQLHRVLGRETSRIETSPPRG